MRLFLESQWRIGEADRIFAQAQEFALNAPSVLYEQARTYIQSRRRLDAARILERYLTLSAGQDDPSRSEALNLLERLPNAPAMKVRQ